MGNQLTLDEISAGETINTDQTVLFRLTSDPFVNEAVADLAQKLNLMGNKQVSVYPDCIEALDEADLNDVLSDLKSHIEDRIKHTHRRSARALAVNRALDELGAPDDDDRRIDKPRTPYPDEQLTVYENDYIDEQTLDDVGIDVDLVEDVLGRSLSGGGAAFILSPEYVGNPSSRSGPKQIDRFERYFATFEASLLGNHELAKGDHPCMICGSETIPTYKGVKNKNLEYNQSFNIFASTTGDATPLGQKSRKDKHRGRCAACLVAGFYYMSMPKVVRQTAIDGNNARLFAPVGDLETLYTIRGDLNRVLEDMTDSTGEKRSRKRTLGQLFTESAGLQTLDFYEEVLREVNTQQENPFEEIERRPTALTHFVSEVGQTRTIDSMQEVEPGEWAYSAVEERSIEDNDTYWPVRDVLLWFASTTDGSSGLVDFKDDIGFGILEKRLELLERGTFEISKAVIRGDAGARYIPRMQYVSDYFTTIMQNMTEDAEIDSESIESIKQVASNIGRLFHGGNDIGVLIQLQNAGTPEQFLQSFEKAAMQAQKKSLENNQSDSWVASKDDDVERVLNLITDKSTFDPTKRMFVIHASLAAQYENVVNSTEGDDDE
ncbi:hypothetical protein [Natronorubrum sp. FCH18a]|uniref:hypothetical protein n=1 Tax=Natronorubrum sp. FCH18a TaxID=3447018 RepID=UPI003F517FD4